MYLGRQSTPLDCMYNNLKIYSFCLSMQYIDASSAILGQRDARSNIGYVMVQLLHFQLCIFNLAFSTFVVSTFHKFNIYIFNSDIFPLLAFSTRLIFNFSLFQLLTNSTFPISTFSFFNFCQFQLYPSNSHTSQK